MLEILIFLVTVIGTISYVVGIRRQAIILTRQTFARTWSNEGDIHSNGSDYIILKLENSGGDLTGSLSFSNDSKLFGIYAEIGWFKTRLRISELQDNTIFPIANATLKLTDNHRLSWCMEQGENQTIFPTQTVLWPYSKIVSSSVDTKANAVLSENHDIPSNATVF
ncbi:hypothetical protein [Crenothrix sp.]|uniref:hypothetical protein n=1 Tax=Crenothrix sp. TaxID=3100433 RepID=UPI00374D43FA